MGNQLIKNYDIQKDPSFVGGFASLWRIFPGTKQDRSAQGPSQVSIFMLDKKNFDKAHKTIKEDIFVFLRKETFLAKYKHPHCLSMVEPLAEDNKNMGFVTEYAQSSLQNYINSNNVAEFYSTDFETKMHLLELLQALAFFHNDLKTAHLGVSPENIYVTANGKWKLGGMIFSTQVLSSQFVDCSNIDFSSKFESYLKTIPNLDFSAPEVCDTPSKCCFASDVFSLGLLIYSLFKSKSDQNTTNIYAINAGGSLATYKSKIGGLGQNLQKEKFFKELPAALKNLLVKMLSPEPSQRPTVSDILGSAWFNDPFIQTIAHLETLAQKDVDQQQLFLKGLSKILLKFESKVIKCIIIPSLLDFLKIEKLSPIILQIIITLLESSIFSKSEFSDLIWPALKALSTGKEIPAQALYLMVSNLKTLCEFITNSDLQTYLMPLILKCYECEVAKLQELALQNTEFLVKKLDFVFIKTKVLPRVLKLCTDGNADLRRNALFCLSKIYHLFERVTIVEQVIGTLEKIKKMGADAKMNVIILNIYEGISKTIGIEVIATKILPNLVGNLADLNLSKSEFKSYLTTIQTLLKKIEEERLAETGGNTNAKEEDSDMGKILKEIEDMDKDQSKKNTEIFSAMQGPSTGNEFDFLNIFETGTVTAQKNENPNPDLSIKAKNKSLEQIQPAETNNIGSSNKPAIFAGDVGKVNVGQKLNNDFAFFDEIENANKTGIQPNINDNKSKSQSKGLFNQTVQMKKNQGSTNEPGNNFNLGFDLNMNNSGNKNNNISNNNYNNNSFNPQNQNTISNPGIGINAGSGLSQSKGMNLTGSQNPKGNMLKLDYDPFADLDSKPTTINQSSNPFAPQKQNSLGGLKPAPTQNVNNNQINFNDFDSIGMGFGTKNVQQNQPQNNPMFANMNFKAPPTQNIQNNFGQNKKTGGDFDFFQNAKPVDQSLKINKINPNFKTDDLI